MKSTKDNTGLRPFRLIRANLKGIVSYQIMYRLLSLAVLFPLMIYTERLLLVVNRKTNVTMANAAAVLKNPLTWLVLLLIVLEVTVFTVVEQYGTLSILHASASGKRHITATEAFDDAIDILIRGFHPGNLLLSPYILLVYSSGDLLDNSSITRFIKIPGFILEHFEKYPAVGITCYAFMFVMSVLAVRLAYVMTVMTVEKKCFTEAARISLKMTEGKRFWSLLGALISCILLLSALIILMFILITIGGIAVVVWLEPAYDWVQLITIENFYILILILTMFSGWITDPVMSALVFSKYQRYRTEDGTVIPEYERTDHILETRSVRIIWTLICAVCIFFSVPDRYRQFKWILRGNSDHVLIMAHRGYSAKAPENTIPAFQAAIDAGATAIELDVQMTEDGTIVVLHDDNTKRTTGRDHNIWEVTYDEIRNLDNGSFFSEEFAGTSIPTLEEAIRFCRGRLYVNIEIKRNGHDEGIGDKVAEIIRANHFQNECDITSQDYATLVDIHEKYPDILLAYTSVVGIGDIQNLDAVSIISIQETFATFENIEALHLAGKKVFVWTVNEEKTMDRLIGLNVDAILTNDPVRAYQVLSGHQGPLDFYKRLEQVLYYLS